MLKIRYHTSFKADYKRMIKRGYDSRELEKVISLIVAEKRLPKEYRDHALKGGKYKGCRECHITPDWLLVYEINEKELILYLTRTGTHSDIFK